MPSAVRLAFRAETAAAIARVRELTSTIAQQRREVQATSTTMQAAAREKVAALVKERAELRQNLIAYQQLARESKRGSEQQIAANRLAAESAQKLGLSYRAAGIEAATAGRRAAASRTESGVARGFTSRASGIGGWMAGPGFIAGAVVGLGAAAGVRELQREQESQALLANALKNVNIEWAANRKAIEAALAARERLSGFDRVELRQSLGLLVRGTGDLTKSQQLLSLATNVARGRHIALEAAVMLVLKANMGMVGILRRQGIDIPKVTSNVDALRAAHKKVAPAVLAHAKALDQAATAQKALFILQQRYGGAAASFMRTTGGRAQELRNNLREVAVTIGKEVSPSINGLLRWLNREISTLQEGSRNHKQFIAILHGLIGAIKAAVVVLKTMFGALSDVAKAVGGWKVAFELILTGLLVRKLFAVTRSFTVFFATVKAGAIESAATMRAAFATTIVGAAATAAILIINNWDKVKIFFAELWNWIQRKALVALSGILWGFSQLPWKMGDWATQARKGVLSQLQQLNKQAAALGAQAGDAYGSNFGAYVGRALSGTLAQALAAAGSTQKIFERAMAHGGRDPVTGAHYDPKTGRWVYPKGGNPFAALLKPQDTTQPFTAPSVPPVPTTGGGSRTGRRRAAPSGAAGVAVARAAESQIGVPYVWGGTRWNVGLDCSGLAQGALAQIGIRIPRTSQQQFAQAKLHPAISELLPGDLVFYEGPHPGHVAVYIGGGRVVHAPHTGTRVQIASVNMMPITGTARYWPAGMVVPSGAGTKGRRGPPMATRAQEAGVAQQIRGSERGMGTALTQLHRIGVHSLDRAFASIRARMEHLRKELTHHLTARQLANIRQQYQNLQRLLNEQLKRAHQIVSKWQKAHQQAINNAIKAVDVARGKLESAWSKMSDRILGAFDRITQAGEAAISAQYDALTPAEAALKSLQDRRQTRDLAGGVSDARSKLEYARMVGDPEMIKQALRDLQDAEDSQTEAGLASQAEIERKARDKARDDAIRDYDDKRQLQRDKLQDMLDDLEKKLANGEITWADAQKKIKEIVGDNLGPVGTLGAAIGQTFMDGLIASISDVGALGTAIEKALAQLRKLGFVWDPKTGTWVHVKPGPTPIAPPVPVGSGHGGPVPQGDVAARFARGGRVPGQYVGRDDTVLAWLTPGEQVLSREDVVAARAGGGHGGDVYVTVNAPNYVGDKREFAETLRRELLRIKGRNPKGLGLS